MSAYYETLRSPVLRRAIPVMRFVVGTDPNKRDIRLAEAKYWFRHGLREAQVLERVLRAYPDSVPLGVSVENALLGATLHDVVGKIPKDDPTRYRIGPLSEEERREHVRAGVQKLHEYQNQTGIMMPQEVFEAVIKHHEDKIGGGYTGISGDELGFVGEWMSIIDPLMTMCEVRTYNGTHPVHSFISAWETLSAENGRYSGEKLEKLFVLYSRHPNAREPGLKWLSMP